MKRYIGLDAHSKSATFVVLNEGGKETARQVVETNGQALVNFLKTVTGTTTSLALEEGTQSQWLYEILRPHVDHIVVAHLQERNRGQKNDALDAKSLAEKLRVGSLGVPVFKADSKSTRLRALVRTYNKLVEDRTRVKNRVRAMFRAWGLSATARSLFASSRRQEEIKRLPVGLRKSTELLFHQLDMLQDLSTEAGQEVIEEAGHFSAFPILHSCPGIGPHRAAELISIVITPERFRTRGQYWSYAGLGVVMHSSSDWEQNDNGWSRVQRKRTRGLNRNRHGRLKYIYKSAATTVIGAKLSPLYDYYQRQLEQGTNPNLAKLSLSRKLATITLTMWKRKENFDPHKV